ncbi:DUF3293 domain-containing protein [Streptomyces sp. NEAU-sy36]|uniref:DUF3293 domain-containing protein n=1 Tax=unclassified Streptomyces TaxID=2593676 RepID=UPI0015D6502C|nr:MULTISPECIES: DUF3293 domain-containing protein [unclassified Streptomyces]QLJ05383.1 DUF3293 domain-containing protein [Streptomyces sp. NEAU-sy36]
MHVTGATVPPRNWDHYRTAVVDIRLPGRTVRVEPRAFGTAEGCFPEAAGGAAVHVITAWNPGARTVSADANARAHRLLLDEVRRLGLLRWPAAGGDPGGTHQEESVAVVGLGDAAARALGRRFGQDAVFAWTPGAWRVLACGTGAVSVSGWAASARGRARSRPAGRGPLRPAPGQHFAPPQGDGAK